MKRKMMVKNLLWINWKMKKKQKIHLLHKNLRHLRKILMLTQVKNFLTTEIPVRTTDSGYLRKERDSQFGIRTNSGMNCWILLETTKSSIQKVQMGRFHAPTIRLVKLKTMSIIVKVIDQSNIIYSHFGPNWKIDF